MIYIPPNGFIGAGQQTQAAQLAAGGMTRSQGNGGRKRRRKAAKRAVAKRAKRSGKGRRFVKGSAAAKRYMAKLRRMRGK